MPFIAAFTGTPCGTCDETIVEGDEIEYDLTDTLVHVTCPETLDSRPVGDICDRCFLTLPMTGICGSC